MRLILPTGPDGTARAYPLDNLLDFSRVTLNEVIDLRRATGMDLQGMQRGFSLLDRIIGRDGPSVMLAMSKHPDLMEAWRALVWLARDRAGDRNDDGSQLTREQAVDFPFAGIDVQPDPGDVIAVPEETTPDPGRPSAGGRGTVGGKVKASKASRGRSSRTSTARS